MTTLATARHPGRALPDGRKADPGEREPGPWIGSRAPGTLGAPGWDDAQSTGLGLYIHWPFCLSKCPYCDFNSHVRERVDEPRFRAALLRELETLSARASGRRVTSVFFGGGTPSLMAAETVGAVLDRIAALFAVAADVEVTLEANPTSAEAARFQGFRSAGVSRLSLGVQALDDGALRALGRTHSVAEALSALVRAQEAFPRVSFDLIYARPGQTEAQWRAELARALRLGTEHLSLYQLTFEPGTPFGARHARGAIAGPDEETAAALYEATQELCEAAGLRAYEIANHARKGAECRHNLVYWRYGDYLGLGPGAHGRVGGRALAAIRAPEAWLKAVEALGHGLAEDAPLAPADQGTEYLLMALRLAEGADLARYERLAGAPLASARLGALVEEGFLVRRGARLAATLKGRLVLNRVIASLLS